MRQLLLCCCGSVAVLALLSGCVARRFGLTEQHTLRLPVGGVKVVRLQNGTGWLRIEGKRGASEIVVSGIARASSQAALRSVRLTSRQSGDTLYVTGETAADSAAVEGKAALDLAVTVPDSLPLNVTDLDGQTFIRDVGPLTLDHQAYGLNIQGVNGDLDLRDGPGEMVVSKIGGNVHIVDGGGAIFLSDVAGSVDVPQDGVGELQIVRVGGDVRIGSKDSGEIAVRDISGNLIVEAHGSGSIEFRNVKGHVTFPTARAAASQ